MDVGFRYNDVDKFYNYIKCNFDTSVELVLLGSFDSKFVFLRDFDTGAVYKKMAPSYAIFEFKYMGRERRVILRKGLG